MRPLDVEPRPRYWLMVMASIEPVSAFDPNTSDTCASTYTWTRRSCYPRHETSTEAGGRFRPCRESRPTSIRLVSTAEKCLSPPPVWIATHHGTDIRGGLGQNAGSASCTLRSDPIPFRRARAVMGGKSLTQVRQGIRDVGVGPRLVEVVEDDVGVLDDNVGLFACQQRTCRRMDGLDGGTHVDVVDQVVADGQVESTGPEQSGSVRRSSS